MAKKRKIDYAKVTNAAERMNMVNCGDHGTWGGNVTEFIYDIKKFTPEEKIIFIEEYLAKERLSLQSWLFDDRG